MDGTPEGIGLSPEAVASPTSAPAEATARPQRMHPRWEAVPDAGASTCVSGSEGSIPPNSQQQQQQKLMLSQAQQQEMNQSTQCSEGRPEQGNPPCLPIISSTEQQQHQQHVQQQQQHIPGLDFAELPCSRVARASSSSDNSHCGVLPVPSTVEAAAHVAAPQGQRGSSCSSCCSSNSIGGELRGLISALAAADTAAGSGELQQLLQQLLAERDLYKAAFGAAKEELKVGGGQESHSPGYWV